jgi:hypothetical protein
MISDSIRIWLAKLQVTQECLQFHVHTDPNSFASLLCKADVSLQQKLAEEFVFLSFWLC